MIMYSNICRSPRLPSRDVQGIGLVELMVAMAIGAVLILGAFQMYVDSRNAYTVNETEARLQENARYALAVMEPDIRMANYWGLLKGAIGLSGGSAQTTAPAAALAGASAHHLRCQFQRRCANHTRRHQRRLYPWLRRVAQQARHERRHPHSEACRLHSIGNPDRDGRTAAGLLDANLRRSGQRCIDLHGRAVRRGS